MREDMLNFSFEKARKELSQTCPTVEFFLTNVATSDETKASNHSTTNSLVMAAAVLLKNRSKRMTAVQLYLTLILNHSSYTVCT